MICRGRDVRSDSGHSSRRNCRILKVASRLIFPHEKDDCDNRNLPQSPTLSAKQGSNLFYRLWFDATANASDSGHPSLEMARRRSTQ